ncbi:3'(2'),5'-bisphosphate nucleotidase CysQ [Altericista sp. CCNU0014]|uniref:3'(2'),5'-bisphosphate nucleotidase CysQ family protein n=1 Tax=Altericista sp. CCNU0014 TaxID=3082949 RepID=UPI00384E5BE9
MPLSSSLPLLQIQTALVEAGLWAKEMARRSFAVEQKGPEDFVTEIDRILDRRLAATFQEWFPEDGVITEENAESIQNARKGFSRLWLIDPIDGTEDFINQRPDYAIMAGLLQDDRPIAGWILRPESGQLFYGGPDWGLFAAPGLEPARPFMPTVTLGPSADYCPVLLGDRDRRQYGTAIQAAIPDIQFYTLGSFGLKVLEVIQGRAGLYLYLNGRVKLWDTVGPLALAQCAGLVCCDLEGNALQFSLDALSPETLAHRQSIAIGWPHYIEALLPRLQEAIACETAG